MTDQEYAAFASNLVNLAKQDPTELGKLIYHYGSFRAMRILRAKASLSLDIQAGLDTIAQAVAAENKETLAELAAELLKIEKIFGTTVLPG
jgi:hypothetical protein